MRLLLLFGSVDDGFDMVFLFRQTPVAALARILHGVTDLSLGSVSDNYDTTSRNVWRWFASLMFLLGVSTNNSECRSQPIRLQGLWIRRQTDQLSGGGHATTEQVRELIVRVVSCAERQYCVDCLLHCESIFPSLF